VHYGNTIPGSRANPCVSSPTQTKRGRMVVNVAFAASTAWRKRERGDRRRKQDESGLKGARLARQVEFEVVGPYDLALSLRAARSFVSRSGGGATGGSAGGPRGAAPLDTAPAAAAPAPDEVLAEPVWIEGSPVLVEVRQPTSHDTKVQATASPVVTEEALVTMARKLVNADLALSPFYRHAAPHPLMGPLTQSLYGLKAFRPASLFEMMVTAVTEQQISLSAAYRIRERLVTTFGRHINGVMAFPAPRTLASASIEELMKSGLSGRKAEYIGGLAQAVAEGRLDLESMESLPDNAIRDRITAIRGFGTWSAEYVLIRGLGRPDVVPVGDLGIQTLLGKILGDGSRMSANGVQRALEPFAPFRGLAVFYLLVGSRLGLIGEGV